MVRQTNKQTKISFFHILFKSVKPLSPSHPCTMGTLIPLLSWLLPPFQASHHFFSSLRTGTTSLLSAAAPATNQMPKHSLNSWLGHLQNILLKLVPYSLFFGKSQIRFGSAKQHVQASKRKVWKEHPSVVRDDELHSLLKS